MRYTVLNIHGGKPKVLSVFPSNSNSISVSIGHFNIDHYPDDEATMIAWAGAFGDRNTKIYGEPNEVNISVGDDVDTDHPLYEIQAEIRHLLDARAAMEAAVADRENPFKFEDGEEL